MDKIKSYFEWLMWVVVGTLGTIAFVYTFAVGAMTIYNNQNLGSQFREVLTAADNGVDVSYSKGKGRK